MYFNLTTALELNDKTLTNAEIAIVFGHRDPTEEELKHSSRIKKVSSCTIYLTGRDNSSSDPKSGRDSKKWIEIANGTSKCLIDDNFCKSRGRKMALARALKIANIPWSDRSLIWAKYHEFHRMDNIKKVIVNFDGDKAWIKRGIPGVEVIVVKTNSLPVVND